MREKNSPTFAILDGEKSRTNKPERCQNSGRAQVPVSVQRQAENSQINWGYRSHN